MVARTDTTTTSSEYCTNRVVAFARRLPSLRIRLKWYYTQNYGCFGDVARSCCCRRICHCCRLSNVLDYIHVRSASKFDRSASARTIISSIKHVPIIICLSLRDASSLRTVNKKPITFAIRSSVRIEKYILPNRQSTLINRYWTEYKW